MLISKLDAARIQLNHAIERFFDEDHVCAVTLGGAAEDLLAGLLQAQNKPDPFEYLHVWYQQEYKLQITKASFSRDILNAARNWLKHSKEDPDGKYDVTKTDSIFMLMRAIPCYRKLAHQHTVQMEKFDLYLKDNKDLLDEFFR
jgi:hypothetical protein